MRPWSAILAAALVIAVVAAPCEAGAQQRRPCHSSDPIDTLVEMSDAIYACWKPPAGTAGMSLTLRFSLRRNGTLIGKPRATYSDLGTDQALNRAFVTSILKRSTRLCRCRFQTAWAEPSRGGCLPLVSPQLSKVQASLGAGAIRKLR